MLARLLNERYPQEYLWTLERNLDSLPDLSYYSDRHHSSLYDISTGSTFTLEVREGPIIS